MAARSSMPDLSGHFVKDGQYQLIHMLGSGTYGVVYRALDFAFQYSSSSSRTSPKVAIKVLRKGGLSSSATRRVRREVASHQRMSDHPNVVTMHDAFEDTDYVYIVLDYCPGGDLFGKLVDEKLYFRNDELAKSVFLQILDAVESCHRKGIYHRDLKPENILTSRDGAEIYLADFGLSTGAPVSEVFGIGSSAYMSAECIGEDTGYLPYSNRANDVWALGVILINMITSRSPWGKAIVSDECFCDFLLVEEYLRETLPISKGANAILRRIFACQPSQRITLPELRKAIVDLDTFYMTDDEIACATDCVRVAASYCGVHVAPAPPAVETFISAMLPASTEEMKAMAQAGDAGSSATESDGPVTPSYCAQDLDDLYVPELNLRLSEFGQPVERLEDLVGFYPKGLCLINVEVEISSGVAWSG